MMSSPWLDYNEDDSGKEMMETRFKQLFLTPYPDILLFYCHFIVIQNSPGPSTITSWINKGAGSTDALIQQCATASIAYPIEGGFSFQHICKTHGDSFHWLHQVEC